LVTHARASCPWRKAGRCTDRGPPAQPRVPRPAPVPPFLSSLTPQTLERIKNGYTYLLPNICEELNAKFPGKSGKPDPVYGQCMGLLSGLSQWGVDMRHWLHMGCYKVEDYGAMELIQPCPTHALCAKITDLGKMPYCKWPTSDSLKLEACTDEKCE